MQKGLGTKQREFDHLNWSHNVPSSNDCKNMMSVELEAHEWGI